MTEINPCLFCEEEYLTIGERILGSKPKSVVFYQARCPACGSSGPFKDTPEAAIAAWNRVAGMREALEAILSDAELRDPFEVEAIQRIAKQVLEGGE